MHDEKKLSRAASFKYGRQLVARRHIEITRCSAESFVVSLLVHNEKKLSRLIKLPFAVFFTRVRAVFFSP